MLWFTLAFAQETLEDDVDIARRTEPIEVVERGTAYVGAGAGIAYRPAGGVPGPAFDIEGGQRLGPVFAFGGLSLSSVRVRGALADPRAEAGTVGYALTESVVSWTVGVRLNAADPTVAIRPELALAVGVATHHSAVRTVAGDVAGTTTEWSASPVLRAFAGLSGRVADRVDLYGGLGMQTSPTRGVLAGDSSGFFGQVAAGVRVFP